MSKSSNSSEVTRKCHACESFVKNDFIKHEKECPIGSSKWRRHVSVQTIESIEDIAALRNCGLGNKCAKPLDKIADEITLGDRAW